MNLKFRLSWRLIWYSVIIWIVALVFSSVVFLPWFYLVMPFFILVATFFYLKVELFPFVKKRKTKDRILVLGLGVSLTWFFATVIFSALEIVGPYYSNAFLYFSDFRNWFLFPLILLIPFVYSLILENKKIARRGRKYLRGFSPTTLTKSGF